MNLWKDKSGSMIIWAPVVMIFLLSGFAAVYQYSKLHSIATASENAVQAALTQVCTDNTKQVYTGVREGYSGGYKIESESWTPDVTSSDILSKVDAKLGTSNGVKTSDGKLVYQISDVSVNVENAPLAPTDTDGAEQLTGTASYTLTVPLSFGWSALPPMVIHPTVKSGYSQQGDLRGSDDSGGDSGTQVTGVSLSESAMTLCKGDTDVLAASILPDNAEDRSISWASANSAVCSVTQSGVITGVNKGSTTVMAISDSGKMAQCDVTVVSPVTGVSLDKSSISMIPGATEQLTETVLPSDADNNGVSWVSSDPSVCTVDSSGNVTAVGAGQSTITVMTQEGGYYAECVVKVAIPVTGITMDKTAMTIAKGATDTLTAVVWPDNATRQDVLWASSDSSVCTVDQSGNIAAVGVGPAVISATTEDGQYVATCNINVVIPVTGVSVSPATLELIKGTTGTVTATVSPSDATDKTVFWTSTDSNITSVDSSGKISANNVGTATISAKTEDGGYTAACAVTVKSNTYKVTLIAGSGGFVTGGGIYASGAVATLTATANSCCNFLCWSDGDLASTRSYTVTHNVTFIATFKSLFTTIDNGDGTCTVTGFDKDADIPNVSIPEYIDGNKVVSLLGSPKDTNSGNDGIFFNNSNVVSVSIPNTVTSIGDYAFCGCTSIQSINIPNSITTIGEGAFLSCESLASINIPDSVTTIGVCAFSDCTSIQSVKIPGSVLTIGRFTFSDCTSLVSIGISDSVQSIGEYAFYNCKSLVSINIPDSVQAIGEYAFFDCESLVSIDIPGPVQILSERVFTGCSSLQSVHLSNSITEIDDYAFFNCTALTSINIPDSIQSIGSWVFHNCTAIKTIDIPSPVINTGSRIFFGWQSNQTIYIHGSNYQNWGPDKYGYYWDYNCNAQIIYE